MFASEKIEFISNHEWMRHRVNLYTERCREILRSCVTAGTRWFFDKQPSYPLFSGLLPFDIRRVKSSFNFYYVYFEIYCSCDATEGILSVETLEIGPSIVKSSPKSLQLPISDKDNFVSFSSACREYELNGELIIERDTDKIMIPSPSVQFVLTGVGHNDAFEKISCFEKLDHQPFTIPCPKCFGKGKVIRMSIPKEAMESDLSGYGLFSENRISGYEGCSLCGGDGVSYENWYLEEKCIKVCSIPSLFCGSGQVEVSE